MKKCKFLIKSIDYLKKSIKFAYALLKRALEDKTYYFEDLRINWLRYGRKDLEAKILKIQLKGCILIVYGLLLV
jgi:hypothetical protein